MDAAGLYLKELPVIAPEMSDEVWAALIGRLEGIPDEEEEQYFREHFRIFSGILAIGSQGCRYEHAIVLNGTHKGRVVNINDELLTKPVFASDETFLDWYERWLDEVISGVLRWNRYSPFGYSPPNPLSRLISSLRNLVRIGIHWP